MANKRGLGWLSRGALLAVAALFVPACGGGGGGAKNPGVTSALWNSTSGVSSGSSGGGLLWIDPNAGPIGGTGGTGDLTYGDAYPGGKWPSGKTYNTNPDASRPVYVSAAQSSTEEDNIEAQVQAYRQAWIRANSGGGGGIGGIGGGGIGIAQLPSLYIGTNLRGTARAVAKDLALGYLPPLESLAALMRAAKLNFTTGSESGYWATAADAATAYNVMGAGVQNRSLGGGWFGGGYWTDVTNGPWWGLVFCDTTSTTGP